MYFAFVFQVRISCIKRKRKKKKKVKKKAGERVLARLLVFLFCFESSEACDEHKDACYGNQEWVVAHFEYVCAD